MQARDTGGLRKLRVKASSRGERAGGRLVYSDNPLYGYLVLIFLYREANKCSENRSSKTKTWV